MTLQTSDFTVAHNFLLANDYKAERNETTKGRARILCTLNSACAAAAEAGGDPDKLEPALAAQVAALDAIFREYARIAVLNTDIVSVQTYMGFALKAQAQCRVTFADLERTRSAREAAPAKPPRPSAPPAEESEKAANELLRLWLERSEGTANPKKSANELLKSQLLSGVSAPSFSPVAPGNPLKSEISTNELLPPDPATQEPLCPAIPPLPRTD